MEAALRQPGFPEIYENVLVPSIFAPWAHELIERARPIGPSDRILDLGCGTGIVARLLHERLGGAARIAGVDANADMLAMARRVAPELEWHEANAMKLPFADASFELVVCQQMLQFVPDRAAAVREIHRVLVPGGRLVLATWLPRLEQPLYETLGTLAERHLGPSIDLRFALGDPAELRALLAGGGFESVQIEQVTRVDHFKEPPVRVAFAATFDLAKLSDTEREARIAAVIAESGEAVKQFAVEGGFAAPTRANLVTARTPGGAR